MLEGETGSDSRAKSLILQVTLWAHPLLARQVSRRTSKTAAIASVSAQ
jgi:hypothetical protein